MFIYLVFKKGICVYVGQTVQTLAQRKGKHLSDARKGRGKALGAAIRKHGEDQFAFIRHIDCVSQEQLNFEEVRLIAELKPRYNLQKGGKSGFDTWNKGKKETRPTVLQNIKDGAKHRKRTKRGKYSAEHVAKISAAVRKKNEKPFICNQTGEIFSTQIQCAEKLKLNPRSLAVLLGKHTRLKSLNGYTFTYL